VIPVRSDIKNLWWCENWKPDIDISKLQAGDVLIVPRRPRLYWENYLTLVLSSLGFLVSVATLILVTAN